MYKKACCTGKVVVLQIYSYWFFTVLVAVVVVVAHAPYWPIFSLSLVEAPDVFAKANSVQFFLLVSKVANVNSLQGWNAVTNLSSSSNPSCSQARVESRRGWSQIFFKTFNSANGERVLINNWESEIRMEEKLVEEGNKSILGQLVL